ncbi:hypothetical protein MSG28_008931 [Choristoneura fumiferana]|uniref:Uncharacterized protein n=1 Tax=Choristoneura fumiferana TaxID=7141 RepID=A0ACC0J8J6_CHOFU|nr:hypothetical protein MSG28_008931 [Choristoneura fumiferana]
MCPTSTPARAARHAVTDSFTDLGLHDKRISTGNYSFTDHGFHDKHIKVEGFIWGVATKVACIMDSRAKRILEMVTAKANIMQTPSNTDDLDQQMDSSDTNSIPDSQNGLDMSLLNESDEYCFKISSKFRQSIAKPNIIVENSDSSDSDSSNSSSSDSSSNDYSSDDSVKDPDYKFTEFIDSDVDVESASLQPGCSNILLLPPANNFEQPCSYDQSSNAHSEALNVVIQPLTPAAPSPGIETEIPTVYSAPPSVDTQPPSVCANSDNVVVQTQHRSRKRKLNINEWQRNKSKLLKNSGKAYISMAKSKKNIEEKKMRPACLDQCKFKCNVEFTNEQRLNIFQRYWDMADLECQRQFIRNNMSKVETKYRYTRVGSNRINMNNAYYLPLNEQRIRVCKLFFMNTLSISDKTIRTVVQKTSKHTGIQLKDGRGKHDNHHKLDASLVDGVKAHINSIPRIESHYCRAQTQREYIEGGLSIASLHRNYVEQCQSNGVQHVTYQIYYNIFTKDFNISFWTPKKDQCEDCTAYTNVTDKASLQEGYDLHLREKTLARAEKETDKEKVCDTFVVSVYDLQAVMPCPQGEVSSFYYISKLNLLNFTITELVTKKTNCYVWHEGQGGRGVNEIGSCVLMYLKKLNDNATKDLDVVFYSDNCCGQQKNKFMLAMYQYAINEYPKLKSITHKFLIKGHTQNEGDAIHSTIQRNISKALKSSPIFVPDQYITLIKTARKTGTPYNVLELTHENFWNLKCLAGGQYTITEDGQKVKWTDIKQRVLTPTKETKHECNSLTKTKEEILT